MAFLEGLVCIGGDFVKKTIPRSIIPPYADDDMLYFQFHEDA
jgi:hypothetical protein